MSKVVPVQLGDRSYDILIGPDLLPEVGKQCRALGLGAGSLVVSDSNVDPLYGPVVEESLASAGFAATRTAVPAGEASKSGEQLFALYDRAIAGGLDRRGAVVALGGGVVGDLAGFAAASLFRGVDYIQVPTSLLAMVDSAVGGKTGINLPHGKNLVGAFYQPKAVIASLDTLNTLPRREFASGMAEVIKYGLIRDPDFFAALETSADALLALDEALLTRVIARCCEIKAEVVREDERETSGVRAELNFGHTLGHAIERVAGYGDYLHGEAIAIGMVYAARLSARQRGFPPEAVDRLEALFRRFGLPTEAPDLEWPALRGAMRVDKKTVSSVTRFVLADDIGRVAVGCEVPDEVLAEVWHGRGE